MANKKQMKFPPVSNPDLEKVIAELKEGAPSNEKHMKLQEELKKARLLSPCDFDVQPGKNADGTTANPTQIKFYLINTNDGKTFFPLFTDIEHTKKINLGKNAEPKYVVRQVKDYDILFQDPKTKADGVVINPAVDNIVIPKGMIANIAGRKVEAAPVSKEGNVHVTDNRVNRPKAPLVARFMEPSVYPTKMAMAIYDRAEETEEIQRVWLKQKVVGDQGSFIVVVESTVEEERVLNDIREVAVPLSKNVPVEVVFSTEGIKKQVVGEAVALYDRDLDL